MQSNPTQRSPMQTSSNFTARVGRWSVRHRKTAIFGWLAFVLVSLFIGMNVFPQKEIDQQSTMPGESGQAAKAMDGAFPDLASEQVLIQSKQLEANAPEFKAAVADVTTRLNDTKGVDNVVGPYEAQGGQVSKDGHSALVSFELPGDSDATDKSVIGALAAVDAAQKANPELRIEESGDASITKGLMDKSNEEMGQSTLLSLPITLIILVFAFGALVAAGIPLLLALTSVAATLGLLGPVSQLAPVDGSVMHVVLLVGMAVGIDYSLFYLKRAREERAAGRENDAAIEAAAATSGRAVLISGFTVMVAMAGMYLGGISNFASFATGTIMVVAVAVYRIPHGAARPALEARRPCRQGSSAARGPHEGSRRRGRPLVARAGPGAAAPAGLGPRGRQPAGGARAAGPRDADLSGRHRRDVS